MSNDTSILERCARAVHSDDLSHRAKLCDVDYVHGLGMAGQTHQQGTALLDLHMTLDRSAAAGAMEVALQVTRDVARKRGWAMTQMRTRRVAGEALALYLNPACAPCKGRGMLGLDRDKPQQGAERARPCPTCGGSGKRPLPLKHRREIGAVLHVMEGRRHAAMEQVRKVMRSSSPVE